MAGAIAMSGSSELGDQWVLIGHSRKYKTLPIGFVEFTGRMIKTETSSFEVPGMRGRCEHEQTNEPR
jgi:hypothetical protein